MKWSCESSKQSASSDARIACDSNALQRMQVSQAHRPKAASRLCVYASLPLYAGFNHSISRQAHAGGHDNLQISQRGQWAEDVGWNPHGCDVGCSQRPARVFVNGANGTWKEGRTHMDAQLHEELPERWRTAVIVLMEKLHPPQVPTYRGRCLKFASSTDNEANENGRDMTARQAGDLGQILTEICAAEP